jgi:NarL family two-component system response regulator YdfI
MTKVLIRALSPLSAAGLEQMIIAEADFSLTKEDSGRGEEEPDVIILEVGQEEESPWGAPLEIAEGGAVVVLLADDVTPGWIGEAMASGVRAVLPRSITREELSAAVRAAMAGLIVIHPDDIASYFPGRSGGGPEGSPPEPLTPREREVLRTMADGLSNKEIASQLGISDHTVKFHVAAIMGKLGATSRTEAVMMAVRWGLLMV